MNNVLYVGIYCRLSKEDGYEESQSISSQKEILTNYVRKNGWKIYDYYIDDGYSGTNFNRPSFQRLLIDIESKRLNIVITKDLSRLGRNYIQTGYYTEEYFPMHQVRFIALNDSFDTDNDECNDFLPFKNIINEWYAKDISKKIRFTLDNKAKRGESRNTVFPIFGYTYNEKYERIPDPETSLIVKTIFKKYLETGSSVSVAKYLINNKIKLPCYYNAIKYNYNKNKILSMSEDELCKWTSAGVRDILTKKEYLGTYITSKTVSKNYKIKKRVINDSANVFEDRYEPLIDRASFDLASQLLKKTRSGKISIDVNTYKGLVFCSKCGRSLKLEQKNNYVRYYCSNSKCNSNITIKKRYLDKITIDIVQLLVKLVLNDTEYITTIINSLISKKIIPNHDVTCSEEMYLNKSRLIDNYIRKLLESNEHELIPKSTYDFLLNKYSLEKKYIEEELIKLKDFKNNMTNYMIINDPIQYVLNKLQKLSKLEKLNYQVIQDIFSSINVESKKLDSFQRKYQYDIELDLLSFGKFNNDFVTLYG